jgi:dethiobiotin synthetase
VISAAFRSSLLAAHGVFVTGTDTGVGKTLISCALLHALRAESKTAIGMKPVATGGVKTADGLISDDAILLQAASSQRLSTRLINPYPFAPPIAPHIAAQAAGVRIEIGRIVKACSELVKVCDVVVMEGVGGFRVPLNESQDTADLAVKVALPIILVVGMRLGCLNHALLTVEAITSRELKFAGWIANQAEAGMQAFTENVVALKERIPFPCLGAIEFNERAKPEAIAKLLAQGV